MSRLAIGIVLVGYVLAGEVAPIAPAAAAQVIGEGAHRYAWVHDWIKLPPGVTLASTHGCVAVDSQDRIYVNTDNEHAVIVLKTDGTFISSWGKEFAKGAHGMCIVKDGDQEVLWLTHLGRAEVVKCTLAGAVLQTIPWPEKSGIYKAAKEYKPTAVAIAANGDVYVADGYGKGYLHRFTAKGDYVQSWNGSDRQGGTFKTPHGVAIDTRASGPRVIVADRANGRLQFFSLDGKYLAETTGMRNPCKVVIRGDDLVIPDLQGRVTIVGKDDQIICHLGDNPDAKKRGNFGLPPAQWKDGEFSAPHGAAWDSQGNLYVEDWNSTGRVSKLARLK